MLTVAGHEVSLGTGEDMIDVPIIDAHMHLWDPEHLAYPWLSDVPQVAGAHLPSDYKQATAGLDLKLHACRNIIDILAV